MNNLFYSLGATLIISLVSFVGVVSLLIKPKLLEKIILWLVGFSAGALMGGAFLHLIPEALEMGSAEKFFVYLLLGFITFFVLEKFLAWHHCHKHGTKNTECRASLLGHMNLVGDGFHNFIDGLVIAASFSVDFGLGIATTVAVLAHEIPQEISDFGVLLYGGLSKTKALIFNFVSALVAVLGAIVGSLLSEALSGTTFFLIAITAGGFIYISASDLIPEMHKETRTKGSIFSFVFFLLGIGLMFLTKKIFE